jgi:hypothetical protein
VGSHPTLSMDVELSCLLSSTQVVTEWATRRLYRTSSTEESLPDKTFR